ARLDLQVKRLVGREAQGARQRPALRLEAIGAQPQRTAWPVVVVDIEVIARMQRADRLQGDGLTPLASLDIELERQVVDAALVAERRQRLEPPPRVVDDEGDGQGVALAFRRERGAAQDADLLSGELLGVET